MTLQMSVSMVLITDLNKVMFSIFLKMFGLCCLIFSRYKLFLMICLFYLNNKISFTVMATSSKSSKSGGRKKTAKKVAKTKSKPTQKKLGIKNAKKMAREILDRQRLLDADDLDSAVLKSKASYSKQKSAETR